MGIAKRLLLFTLLLVFSVTIVVGGLFARHAQKIIQDQVEKRGAILVQAVTKQALDSIRQGNTDLQGVIQSLHHDPDVEIAIVVDTAGTILAHTDPRRAKKKLFLTLWDQEVMKSSKPLIQFDTLNNRYVIGLALQGPKAFIQEGAELAFPVAKSSMSLG